MDDIMIAAQFENIDKRLGRIEQILPTLATKEELRLAIAAAVEPLVTRLELDAGLAAQSAELRREIREEGERSRRHVDVLIEGQRADIQLLAEHLSVVMAKLADR